MELEVSVVLDADLGLETSVRVPHGAVVRMVKEELCRSDPTNSTREEDIHLLPEPPGASRAALRDDEPLGERRRLRLVPTDELDAWASAAGAEEDVAQADGLLAEGEVERCADEAPAADPAPTPAAPAAQAAGAGGAAVPPTGAAPDAAAALLGEAAAALGRGADEARGDAAVRALTAALEGRAAPGGARARLLVARGFLFWRWSMLDRALADFLAARGAAAGGDEGAAAAAGRALLALRLCLSQWPGARELAAELRVGEVSGLVDTWCAAAQRMQNLFFPQEVDFQPDEAEVLPGVFQRDFRAPAHGGAQLGLRLLLRRDARGAPDCGRPLLLCFHGEDESVETYAAPEVFAALASAASGLLVAGFRGYGCSAGSEPDLAVLRVDGDSACDALPGAFARLGLPWPWPGRLVLYGNSLGSRVACYLAGTRGEATFDGGLVLESAWCGSFAPGARPLPEPPKHMALAAMGSNAVGDSRFGSRELLLASSAIGRYCAKVAGEAASPDAPVKGGLGHFCYTLGNEDLLRGFAGRLLLLHGEVDHVIPADHARRLCDAARAATRRLVLATGKRYDSLRSSPQYAEALRKFLSER